MYTASVTYRGPLERKTREFNTMMKTVLTETVLVWHGTSSDALRPNAMLQEHFKPTAYGAYGSQYQPRTKGYNIQKAKKYGHNNPLEYSGKTKTDVSSKITISGTSKSARGRMTGANRALNFGGMQTRTYKGRPIIVKMPEMREELLAITQAEAQKLANFVDVLVQAFLRDQAKVETLDLTSGGSGSGLGSRGPASTFTGSRGGVYTYTASGNKRYIRR